MRIGETIKVTAGNVDFFVKYSNRAFAAYMEATAKNPDAYDTKVRYFYELSKSGAKAEGKEFNYSFEEFSDIIDPDPMAIANFFTIVSGFFPEAGGDEKKQKKSSK